MQLLEADLGVQLFKRSAKGMHLTEEGDYLRDAVTHHVEQIELALQNVGSLSTRAEVTCRLGLPPGIATVLGPRLLTRFRTEMANLNFILVEDESWRLGAELLRGTVDIAILAGAKADQRLFSTELLTEPLLLVGAPGSSIESRDCVSFDDVVTLPLVLPPAPHPLLNTLEKLGMRAGAKINVVNWISGLDVIKELLKGGALYSVMAPVTIKGELDRGELVGVPIGLPQLSQSVVAATQPHWRIPRSTYNQFHHVFYSELAALVASEEWPATWLVEPDEVMSRRW